MLFLITTIDKRQELPSAQPPNYNVGTPMFIQPLEKEQQAVYESVMALPKQCLDGFSQAKKLKLPAAYKKAKRIIVTGMGGSNLGFRLLRSVALPDFKTPMDLANHYQLPAYADKNTLVIACSYSGNTEETLMVAQQAHKKKCMVLTIATGGKLIQWARHVKRPHLQFETPHNPSNQPRLAVGYATFTLLGVLGQLGYKISEKDVKKTVRHLENLAEDWSMEESEISNKPARLAKLLHGFIPVYIAAEHLHGNIRIAQNQTHETAKSFAAEYSLPELNHHLMEGLKNPKTYAQRLRFVAFTSELYTARNRKRFEVTKDVVEQQGITWLEYQSTADSTLGEACEVLLFSSLLTFYLSLLYKENPVVVPWVDYFKKELGA